MRKVKVDSWQNNPVFWFGLTVAAGIISSVTASFLQVYWLNRSLMNFAEKTALAQPAKNGYLGKYRVVN